MVEQPYSVCRPVTTVRQETVECGYYERQYITVPGPVVERRVRVPVQECDLCGEEQPRGLLGCLHHKRKVTATVAVQCPPRTVCQRVWVSRPVTREVSETRYVRETMVRQVPVTQCRYVSEQRVESTPVTTCSYVSEERVEPYEVQTCNSSPKSGSSLTKSRPAATSPRNGSSLTRFAPARWWPSSGWRPSPLPPATMSLRSGRALRSPDLPARRRGARGALPGHNLQLRRRGTGRARTRADLPHGRRDGLAPGSGLCRGAGSRDRQPRRRPTSCPHRGRAAMHHGARRHSDLPDVPVSGLG